MHTRKSFANDGSREAYPIEVHEGQTTELVVQ